MQCNQKVIGTPTAFGRGQSVSRRVCVRELLHGSPCAARTWRLHVSRATLYSDSVQCPTCISRERRGSGRRPCRRLECMRHALETSRARAVRCAGGGGTWHRLAPLTGGSVLSVERRSASSPGRAITWRMNHSFSASDEKLRVIGLEGAVLRALFSGVMRFSVQGAPLSVRIRVVFR